MMRPVPVLKQALKEADLPAPKISLVVPAPAPEPVDEKSTDQKPAVPVPVPTPPPPPPRHVMSSKEVNQFALSFENATHSECILIAEYLNYDKNAEVHFTHPPIANYRITKILKGPPLNKDLPVRYEFTDRINDIQTPQGWTFGPDKMPAKGSKWIIFIKNAVPRDDAFDTYQGAYGRQPATEENLNRVYTLLENSANR